MQDLFQVRNANYSSPEISNFLITSNPLEYQELGASTAEPNRLIMHQHHQQHYGSFPQHKQQYYSELISDFGNCRNRTVPHQVIVTDWLLNGEMHQNHSLQDIVNNRPDSNMASLMHHNAGQGNCVGNATESELQQNHLNFGWKNQTDSNKQSLSLSLSSNVSKNKAYNVSQFDQVGTSTSRDEFQTMKYVKPSIISKDCGKSLQDMVVGMIPNSKISTVGPLGPFTGYATVLKNSRFLKIAQNLLDEFCSKFETTYDVLETEFASKGSNYSCSSSSMFHSADLVARSNFGVSMRPDYQQIKTKLMCMQEEVSRRYKQYHQQMQMVFASFESVAGLNSATPYITLAMKSVSKHFKSLNNAISNQLKLISEVLRNDSSIPTTNNSSKLIDTNVASLKCMDQNLQKNKPDKGPAGFHDPQLQHVWRPQRGFPERAVGILKAWLFEHFLHPYPTDIDKHMLATQTGLSRNQVSNWFINARVRVWKPMVEEVHMLDKKTTDTGESSSPNEGTFGTVGSSNQLRMDKASNKYVMQSIPEDQIQYMEFGSISIDTNAEENEAEQWRQEKRSKLECGMSSRMDGTLMDFLPYRHSGHDVVQSLGLDLFH
ncbi:unnamed protein product [Trifolium pratense]|uniref:Uncharacterized protein n=2 Tax=Trifolium pratense TaxID=57577 RepID=A0ACB0KUC9_TRIPR|nr:unnamed protein product [Trifolium pratense]